MTNQNSAPPQFIRPEDLMEELNIKKDTYYGDLKFLGIKADKDTEGKAYLTFEQAEQIRSLRSHVNETGKRDGFGNSLIVKVDDSKLVSSTEDIYVEPSEPDEQFDLDILLRSAAELKTRELAMAHLVKRALADQMSEDSLPSDLQDKLAAAREAANPKFTPTEVAVRILSRLSNQGGN